MKKKIVALMLSVMMVMSVTACGSDKENTVAEGTEVPTALDVTEVAEGSEQADSIESVLCASSEFDLKGSDYVTLCDYNAINVTITGDYDVDDADVEEYFKGMFDSYGPFYKEDPDKTVIEEGDIVNVDYVGKLDGEAFEGGTAENQLIDVYNNASTSGSGYIDGFTDGLKGASVGDVLDCDVTFPEDYGNTDLAGKAVVFTFTVNSIQKEISFEEVDDAFAQEQFQVDTVDAMYDEIREYMEQNADYNKQRDTYLAVQEYLIDNCTVEVPEDYLAARLSDYKRQFIEKTCDGDESKLEQYASDYYGKTVEELEAYWKENMDKSIRLELIMDAIAEEMGVELDQEDYDTYVSQLVSSNGYESAEAMYNFYGYGDTVYGETYFNSLYTYDVALEDVTANAVVNVEAAEVLEDTEAVEETEAE